MFSNTVWQQPDFRLAIWQQHLASAKCLWHLPDRHLAAGSWQLPDAVMKR